MKLMLAMLSVLLLILAGCATRVPPCPIPPLPGPVFGGITNFDVVSDQNILRGGQPDLAGFKFLKSLGVTTILKLNTDAEGNDAAAVALGITVVKIPIDLDDQIFGPVPVEAIKQFWWNHPDNVFVHCLHGQDRTGLACYLYNRQQGCSKAVATDDMLCHGFHKVLFGLWEAAQDN